MSDRRPQQLAADLLNVLEEAAAIFKAEEAKLHQVLMQVQNIVGPKVATWIDEDVAASMKAGRLVCRDYFDDELSTLALGDVEDAGHTNRGHKGKEKAAESPIVPVSRLFPPSLFPPVRPAPPTPEKPQEYRPKPLQRDTRRVRANSVTGEFEVFDYETTREYKERLRRDHYDIELKVPLVSDSKADFQTLSELDGPHFKFDRGAWRSFEDDTLMPSENRT